MAKKYVDRWLKCQKRGTYFLTPDDVHVIRYLFSEGWTRYRLARDYGISWPTVNRVVKSYGRYARPLTDLGNGFNRDYHPPKEPHIPISLVRKTERERQQTTAIH
jgi:hypothetical protein